MLMDVDDRLGQIATAMDELLSTSTSTRERCATFCRLPVLVLLLLAPLLALVPMRLRRACAGGT